MDCKVIRKRRLVAVFCRVFGSCILIGFQCFLDRGRERKKKGEREGEREGGRERPCSEICNLLLSRRRGKEDTIETSGVKDACTRCPGGNQVGGKQQNDQKES
jgi:hypothetical protein